MAEILFGKQAPKAASTSRVYGSNNSRQTSQEHARREFTEQNRDKSGSLKDLPEEVKNYYSKHGSDGHRQHAEPGPDHKFAQDAQGHGSKLSPDPATPVKPAVPAVDGAATSPTQSPGPGHPDDSHAKSPGPNPATSPDHKPATMPAPAPAPKPHKSDHHKIQRYKFLSTKEWTLVAHGLGGIVDRESQTPIHPTNFWWPPEGMPPGLYRDVIIQRIKFCFAYRAVSWFRWILMFLQLVIGAVLTAIGSMELKNGIPVTVLGAANTVIAGLLAFLQNSGLPERYRFDKAEFESLEDHIKELLDSGIAPADKAPDQILAECFSLFQDAKSTVASNLPANYTTGSSQPSALQKMSEMMVPSSSKHSSKDHSEDHNEKNT